MGVYSVKHDRFFDVYAPELRNPRVSGMSKNRKTIAERIADGLNRLLGQKQ